VNHYTGACSRYPNISPEPGILDIAGRECQSIAAPNIFRDLLVNLFEVIGFRTEAQAPRFLCDTSQFRHIAVQRARIENYRVDYYPLSQERRGNVRPTVRGRVLSSIRKNDKKLGLFIPRALDVTFRADRMDIGPGSLLSCTAAFARGRPARQKHSPRCPEWHRSMLSPRLDVSELLRF
jgi:hypothetical protein